jgi:hypothetical protein
MFDTLKKFIDSYRQPLAKHATGLLKDAAYAGVHAGKFIDSAVGASDRLSKTAFKHFGPAPRGLINATDAVSRSTITAKAVGWATSGGPLTKAGKFGWGVGKAADSHWNLSDRASKSMLKTFGPAPTIKPAVAKPSRSVVQLTKLPTASIKPRIASAPLPTLKLHLPKFGKSLPHAKPLSLGTPKLHLQSAFKSRVPPQSKLSAPFKLTAPTFRAPAQMHRPPMGSMRLTPPMRFHR